MCVPFTTPHAHLAILVSFIIIVLKYPTCINTDSCVLLDSFAVYQIIQLVCVSASVDSEDAKKAFYPYKRDLTQLDDPC